MIDDFTRAELKRLDAGAWFDPKCWIGIASELRLNPLS